MMFLIKAFVSTPAEGYRNGAHSELKLVEADDYDAAVGKVIEYYKTTDMKFQLCTNETING